MTHICGTMQRRIMKCNYYNCKKNHNYMNPDPLFFTLTTEHKWLLWKRRLSFFQLNFITVGWHISFLSDVTISQTGDENLMPDQNVMANLSSGTHLELLYPMRSNKPRLSNSVLRGTVHNVRSCHTALTLRWPHSLKKNESGLFFRLIVTIPYWTDF